MRANAIRSLSPGFLTRAVLASAILGMKQPPSFGIVSFNLRQPPTPQEIEEQEFKRELRRERKQREKVARLARSKNRLPLS